MPERERPDLVKFYHDTCALTSTAVMELNKGRAEIATGIGALIEQMSEELPSDEEDLRLLSRVHPEEAAEEYRQSDTRVDEYLEAH